MTGADVLHLLPLIILVGGTIVGMLGIAVYRSHVLTLVITLGTLIGSLVTLRFPLHAPDEYITPLIRFDGYAIFFMGLLLLTAVAVAVMAYGYMRGRSVVCEELYVLLLVAKIGRAHV